MHRLCTICLFAVIGAGFIYGQAKPEPPLPPAMQGAINRILSRTPNPEPIQLHNPPAGVCSAPLLELRVQHPERFPIYAAPVPNTRDAMPAAQAPAPPCKESHPPARP